MSIKYVGYYIILNKIKWQKKKNYMRSTIISLLMINSELQSFGTR